MTNKPSIIDTHAHIDDAAYDDDRQEVLERARHAGVVAMINPGSDLESSRRAVEYAHKTDDVFAAIGMHPHAVAGKKIIGASAQSQADAAEFEKALAELDDLAKDPVVVALGEFGLDMKYDGSDLEVQAEAFKRQAAIARKHSMPIILHCRSLYDDLERLIRKEAKEVPGVVHCFAGGTKELNQLIDLGLHIAIGGIVTFKNNTEGLREAAKKVPLDRLLLETDSPYLTPEPRRGNRNEPEEVVTVAQVIADLREISYAELAEATTSNARKLFALPDVFETEKIEN